MNPNINRFALGELFEWSMEAVLKTVGLTAPGVRIPHSPIFFIILNWIRRGARVAEGGCLLSNCIVLVPGVRIPPSPDK